MRFERVATRPIDPTCCGAPPVVKSCHGTRWTCRLYALEYVDANYGDLDGIRRNLSKSTPCQGTESTMQVACGGRSSSQVRATGSGRSWMLGQDLVSSCIV